MMTQATLFETVTTPYGVTYSGHAAVTSPQHDTDLDARFAEWIAANPQVLDAFCERALVAMRAGRTKIGAKRIIEVMRWDMHIPTTGNTFKFNNSFTSRMVRAAIARHPELDDLFEQRELWS